MKRDQQSCDGDFAYGIGEQLQGLCLPQVCLDHSSLMVVKTLNVFAETEVDSESDQDLARKR